MDNTDNLQPSVEDDNADTADSKNTTQSVKAESGSAISNVIQVAGDYNAAPPASVPLWARLWPRVQGVLFKHWILFLTLLVADGLLLILYLTFTDRYLIEPLVGASTIALATVTILGWYVLATRKWRSKGLWPINIVATLLLVGGLTWQAKQITQPEQFAPRTFGVAVALFGEGADFRVTSRSRDVTDQVLRGLEDAIRDNPSWKNVQVRPIGVVADGKEARTWGQRVHAALVVWGQVTDIGGEAVSINFEILETPDRAYRPAFPLILPVTTNFTRSSASAPLPGGLKEWVAQQSQVITAFSLGLAAYLNRDYGSAVAQLLLAANTIKAAPGNMALKDNQLALVYFYLGRSFQRSGQIDKGQPWLEQATVHAPDDPAIPLAIAYGLSSLGRNQEARDLAGQVVVLASNWLEIHHDDLTAAYDRGLAYSLLDEPRLAAEEFDAILKQAPDFYIAYLSAGQAYVAAKDIPKAIERFQSAMRQAERYGTDGSWAYLFLADAYREGKEFGKARAAYQRAVALAPDVDWMHFRQATFYEDQNEMGAAETAYRQTLDKTLDEAWAHAMLAGFFRRQSRDDEAIQEYETVRQLRPSDALSQIYLAELYLATSRPELARKTFEQALKQSPGLQYGHVSYGNALVRLGDYAAAIERFKIALQLAPNDGIARFNLGRALEISGQISAAQAEYEAIAQAPTDRYPEPVRQVAQQRLSMLSTPVVNADLSLLLPPTPTPSLWATPTALPSSTPTPTLTPSSSPTLLPPSTPTPSPSPCPTPTFTPKPSATLLPLPTPAPTATLPPH